MLRFCRLFFFFKQKTAYEMRISDWSSDVCSSDLPLMLDQAEAATPVGNSAELTDERLVALLDEAKRAWIESTLVNVTAEELANIEIRVENFGSGALATYSDGVITIDDDAAGVGWFIDLTPAESSEFAASATHILSANGASAAEGRIDLLTVLTHEIGHQFGLPHAPASQAQLMNDKLGAGERRLPSEHDIPVIVTNGADAGDDGEAGFQNPFPTTVLPPVAAGSGNGPSVTLTPAAVVGGAVVTTPIANADFAGTQGWQMIGGASVAGGVGILSEAARLLSSLRQLFAVPAGAHDRERVVEGKSGSVRGNF